jgi:hypothetical protein
MRPGFARTAYMVAAVSMRAGISTAFHATDFSPSGLSVSMRATTPMIVLGVELPLN